MQLNRDYESEINLKGLFFHVLYRWRSILIVALVGAVLLGGYKYLSMNKSAESVRSVQQAEELSLEITELNRKIEEKTKQVDDLATYLNESMYINLNPQGVWTGSSKYLIIADVTANETLLQGINPDPADIILPVYTYPLSDAPEEELIKVFNTNKHELIDELVSTEINPNENSIKVTVKGASVESVQNGLDYIHSRMDMISVGARKLGEHTLMNVGKDIVLMTEIVETTDALPGRRSSLASALDQYRSELQALRDRAEAYKTNGQSLIHKNELIRYSLLGFIIGAFLMICLYAFHYVLGGRLLGANELSEQYNLPIFGETTRSASIHNDKGLDKLLSRWELGKTKSDGKTMAGNICALIEERQDVKDVLLVSTLKDEKLGLIRDALKARMEDKAVDAKGNFLINSEAVTQASRAAAVILVEEKGVSRNKDIERMVQALMISRANVIGAIVL